MSDAPVYIHGLKASDFLRLELVSLRLDGPGLTQITGDNASGKSSLLRSIMAALGGKEALPAQPVRRGAKKSEIEVDLGDKIVKLRVREDRSATLTVEGKDGAVFRSPQALLNEMVGKLAFDPLDFLAKEKEQAGTLRKLVGIDTTAMDAERQQVFDSRTLVNRECKLLDAQLDGIVVPEHPGEFVPAEIRHKENVSGLAVSYQAAVQQKRDNDAERERLDECDTILKDARQRVEQLKEELAAAETDLDSAAKQYTEQEGMVSTLVNPDVAGVAAKLQAAESVNSEIDAEAQAESRRHQEYQERWNRRQSVLSTRDAKEAETRAKHNEAGRLTLRLEKIDEEKRALLAQVKFPCEGLGVDGDVVTFQGVPLTQASTGEQLSVCLSVAAALNPRLRVLLVRSGNDLDQNRLRQTAEWATANGYQVLLERVAGDTPIGIVIEAGKVALDARAGAA